MIAIDTSAVVAILWQELDWERLRGKLAASSGVVMSMGSILELQLVLAGARALSNWDHVEALFGVYRITARPFDEAQLRIAREAALRFGKGRHRAALNFGDCFAYALARSRGEPLLFKGNDFGHTDITPALRTST